MGTQHVVTMLPGEGTGPELCEAVRLVIDASGVNIK
jgi:isocitrate dehydrogenase (NAD+)